MKAGPAGFASRCAAARRASPLAGVLLASLVGVLRASLVRVGVLRASLVRVGVLLASESRSLVDVLRAQLSGFASPHGRPGVMGPPAGWQPTAGCWPARERESS
jgi:hypothetical protein